MSWLPSGLSNITGQITSFTKEVLSEGAEEIDDHATELRAAKSRINELDRTCVTQRAELDRLKFLMDELTVQLQSKELQIQSCANDYRKAMDLKEKEMKELKQRHADLSENFSNASLLASDQSSMIHFGMKVQHSKEFSEDFHDVISSQHEINHLRNEVRRLEAEVVQWRQSCDSQSKVTDDAMVNEDKSVVSQLQSHIMDLQRQLADEVDRHQHELAALHDVHRQSVSVLKKSHKTSIDQLQLQLQQKPGGASEKTKQDEDLIQFYKGKLEHFEQISRKLEYDLELTHAADLKKAELLEEKGQRLEQMKAEIGQLLEERQAQLLEQETMKNDIQAMSKEQFELLKELNACKSCLQEKDDELNHQQKSGLFEYSSTHSGLMSSTPVAPTRMKSCADDFKGSFIDDSTGFEEFSGQNHQLDEQVKMLQSRIEEYEQQLEQFELLKSDWQLEKQALEGVLKKLRDELKEKEEEHSIVQARKGLMETKQQSAKVRQETMVKDNRGFAVVSDNYGDDDDDEDYDDIKVHAQKLDQQIELLASENAQLEMDRDRLLIDKKQLSSELELQRHLVEKLELQLQEFKASASVKEMDLLLKMNELVRKKELFDAKELQSDERMAELDNAVSQVKRLEDTADENVVDKNSVQGSEILNEELQKLKEKMSQMESEWGAHMEKARYATEMLRTEKRLLMSEKQALEENMEELDASHQEAMNQIIKSRNDIQKVNEDLKQQVIHLEQQILEKLPQNISEENRGEMEMEDLLKKKLRETEEEYGRARKELACSADKVNELQAIIVQLEHTTYLQRTEIESLKKESLQLLQETEVTEKKLQHLEVTQSGEDYMKLEEELNQNKQQVKINERNFKYQLQHQKETYEEQVQQLQHELETSRSDIAALVKDLSSARDSLDRKDEEIVSFGVQIDNIRMVKTEVEAEVRRLQAKCNDLEKLLDQRAVELHIAGKEHEKLDRIQIQKDEELGKAKDELKSLKEMFDQSESVATLYEAEVERLETVEEKHASLLESFQNLQQEVERWKNLARFHDEHASSSPFLNQNIEVPEALIQNIVEQDGTGGNSEKYRSLVDELQRKVQTLELENILLKKIDRKKSDVESCIIKTEYQDQNQVQSEEGEQSSALNGQLIQNWKKSLPGDNLVRLKTTVSQQEELIKTLNGKYSSMLRLLEDRSMSVYGSTVLADVHRLENEVQALRAEKEHMMIVLNEKTREASSLKSEVHQLMSVVSAGKVALSKLQQDTQDMVKNQEVSNFDMKKEAIKKLSQLVKDRDIEIEALKEKNATLLQVLQSSSSDEATHQISDLIQERDNLQRQIVAYQNDRDQIINTLNIKHQESLSYYAEVERLGTLVAEMTEQKEKLDRNYSNLSVQYEDKQKSLMKALNELTNYKQLIEMEKRYSVSQERFDGHNVRNDRTSSISNIPGQPMASVLLSPDVDSTDLMVLKQNFEKVLAERDVKLSELGRRADDNERILCEKEQLISSKEQEVSALSVKLHMSQANFSAKESELNSMRKQCENLTFKIQGLTTERTELISELDSLRKRCENLLADVQLVKQANTALTINVSSKDLEITTLTEKVRSLENSVQQHGANSIDGGYAQAEHLMREIDMLKKQAQLLQQDRDHLYVAVHQFQSENMELKTELIRLQEKEQRLAKECERLRGHLLVIEEGNTHEALEAEEREKELRNRLAAVEEKVLSSNTAVLSARSDASRQVENLQIQIHTIADQRDNALLQLANAHETITSYANSLSNLQMVLEQFQAERQHQQIVEIERYKRDFDIERAENQRLQLRLNDLQRQLDESTEALSAAERLSEQLDKKEGTIAALREEVLLRENELRKAETELRKLTSSTEVKMDKVIVKNLFIGYFHAPPAKRPEAFQVIGHILSFTKEEMEEISRNSLASESWIGGLFRRKSASSRSSLNQAQGLNQSFSELFVKFLEQESAPQPLMRFPAELMAQEQQDRRHQQQKLPAFNPFSAPVDSSVPLTLPALSSSSLESSLLAGASVSSHLLMGPSSQPRLPIFAPASIRADTPSQGRDSSTASSGRSTPSGSGAILHDILQQR